MYRKADLDKVNKKSKEKYIKRKLATIALDMERLEKFIGKEVKSEEEEVLVEFLKEREKIKIEVGEWLADRFKSPEDSSVFWSYITEAFQNLLLPDLDEINIFEPGVMEELDKAIVIAEALENFHMSSMSTYMRDRLKNKRKGGA